ncbi:MAG: hypothetical protein M3O03_07280 [Pseudomonadota bacterium]|nr:hypothetical protein [Pseudomonadota bacterium]
MLDHAYYEATSAEDMLQLGLQACQGLAADRIEAHKWFNLSALKGCMAARCYRTDIAAEMQAFEIAEAQRRAREILTLH